MFSISQKKQQQNKQYTVKYVIFFKINNLFYLTTSESNDLFSNDSMIKMHKI